MPTPDFPFLLPSKPSVAGSNPAGCALPGGVDCGRWPIPEGSLKAIMVWIISILSAKNAFAASYSEVLPDASRPVVVRMRVRAVV
jgi:hypothetical protein